MLPQTLLCLLSAVITAAQTVRRPLLLNEVMSVAQSTTPPVFTIPNGPSLTITVASCSDSAGGSDQRFFLTNNNPDPSSDPGPGGDGVVEIVLNQGLGLFTGPFPNGGVLSVSDQGSFEVGVSDSGKHLRVSQMWQPNSSFRQAQSTNCSLLYLFWETRHPIRQYCFPHHLL